MFGFSIRPWHLGKDGLCETLAKAYWTKFDPNNPKLERFLKARETSQRKQDDRQPTSRGRDRNVGAGAALR